jgi:sortase (surface protein transpeptidase)
MRYAIVTFFVIMASYLAFDTWNTNQKIQTVVSGDSASATTGNGQHAASADVENPPIQGGVAYPDYQVADDMPRILSIPSLSLTARVSEVGLTNANKIDVPSDASFAGWYNGSAKLGSIGAAFITGHYNGVDAGGIFDNLSQIQNGATVTIEMGDGSKLNYEVVNVENTPIAQVDMSRTLSPSDGVVEGLNIMTCQGTWSGAGFSHRLTAYTRRV